MHDLAILNHKGAQRDRGNIEARQLTRHEGAEGGASCLSIDADLVTLGHRDEPFVFHVVNVGSRSRIGRS
jgi:hypothetical protein